MVPTATIPVAIDKIDNKRPADYRAASVALALVPAWPGVSRCGPMSLSSSGAFVSVRTVIAWAAIAIALSANSQAVAQTAAQPAGQSVVAVTVEGNKNLSSAAVLAYAKTRVGQQYDDALLQADERRMLQSGYFESVSAIKTQTDRGIAVTFAVVERAKIAKITFSGNKVLKTNELLKELPFKVGQAINTFSISKAGRDAILRKYHDNGYYYVTATVDDDALANHEVRYIIVEGPRVAIRNFVFDGNTFFSKITLPFKIESSRRFWPFVKGVLDDEMIKRDADTLRNLYIDEGFLDAEVQAEAVFPADKTAAKQGVTLVFHIKQGPRYRVNIIIVNGNVVYSSDEIFKKLNLSQGEFFTAERVKHDTKAVQDMYGELGYIEARVDTRKQLLDPSAPPPTWATALQEDQTALVNFVIDVAEADQYRIGKINIRGNTMTQSRVIRREARFYPEQLFNTVAVEESRSRLMDTRMFSEVTITPVPKSAGIRDALINVKEADTANFIIGAGYSSNDGLIGNITFTQRNFDITAWPNENRQFWKNQAFKGAGQTLNITLEPGLEVMRASVDWTDPSLMDGPYQLSNRLFVFQRDRETYTESRFGEVVSLGRRFNNGWYGELSQRLEGVEITDLDDDAPPEVIADEGGHFIPGTKAMLVRDRTDSRWNPTTGDRFSVSYEQVVGEYMFGRAEADYHIYRTVYKDALDRKHVLAGKLAAGRIFGDSPVFENYYGGGSGSIRGFEYRGISPRSHGEPIGGQFMFLAGTEYSYPLIAKALRGVFFLDTGTVEKDTGLTTYRAAVGFGFRIDLPMMSQVPIAVDFGFPIAKDKDDDTQIFSFSMGVAF
jgi:outer membrane protein insertion porin family